MTKVLEQLKFEGANIPKLPGNSGQRLSLTAELVKIEYFQVPPRWLFVCLETSDATVRLGRSCSRVPS